MQIRVGSKMNGEMPQPVVGGVMHSEVTFKSAVLD